MSLCALHWSVTEGAPAYRISAWLGCHALTALAKVVCHATACLERVPFGYGPHEMRRYQPVATRRDGPSELSDGAI